MTAETLRDLINTCAKGVGQSEFGPLMESAVDENQTLKKTINPVCFQIFMTVLNQAVQAEMQRENKEEQNVEQ